MGKVFTVRLNAVLDQISTLPQSPVCPKRFAVHEIGVAHPLVWIRGASDDVLGAVRGRRKGK
jgi:hypothetical protein